MHTRVSQRNRISSCLYFNILLFPPPPISLPLFLSKPKEFPLMGPRCERCVHLWSLCDPISAEQSGEEQSRPAMGAESPVGHKFWPRTEDRSAPHWISGCNSPSVGGLGWCGGRGELQVSHGKACFIVCLGEWRIEGRGGEKERERDGRRWGWMGRGEVGGWTREEQSREIQEWMKN